MSSIKRKKVVRPRAAKAKKGSAKRRLTFAKKLSTLSEADLGRIQEAGLHGLAAVVTWAAFEHYADDDDPIEAAGLAVGRALLEAADQFGDWNRWGQK